MGPRDACFGRALFRPGLSPVSSKIPIGKSKTAYRSSQPLNHITSPFLLTMSDHLFDDAIVDLLIDSSNPDMLNIAVDRKLESIRDLDDAMKVQRRGNRVVSIGKDPRIYDAIDTGLFICPLDL